MTVEEIINPLIEVYKKNLKGEKKDYCANYLKMCCMADEIAVHSEIGNFPTTLFRSKAPNEDPAQWNYRKDNFRHTTGRIWSRMVQELHRIWNEQNYVITWPEANDAHGNPQQDYFLKEYPHYHSLLNYFESIVTAEKVNDPNAVLVIEPGIIPMIEQEMDGGTVMAVNDAELLSPVANIYSCHNVWAFEDDYVLVRSMEQSIVTVSDKPVNEGLVFYLFDPLKIWKIAQTGKKEDYNFDIQDYFTHDLGYIPAWRLEGLPVKVDDHILHKSIYYGAVPCLDSALYDSSTLDISKTAHAFPQRWEYSDVCHHQGCDGTGKIQARRETSNGTVEYETNCPSCNGTGRKSRFSPLGVMQIDIPNTLNNADMVNTPPAGYIEPGTQILEFLEKSIQTNINNAYELAGISIAEYKQGETATGRMIDREALLINVQKFSDSIFSLFEKTIRAIGTVRFINFEGPVISRPVNFDLRSEADLTMELNNAKTAGLPQIAIDKLTKEWLSCRFTNNADMQAKLDLIMATDALATMSNQDVISGLGMGYIQKWEAELHKNINIYIDEELKKNDNFLSEPNARETLITRAKADSPQEFKAENILAGINGK